MQPAIQTLRLSPGSTRRPPPAQEAYLAGRIELYRKDLREMVKKSDRAVLKLALFGLEEACIRGRYSEAHDQKEHAFIDRSFHERGFIISLHNSMTSEPDCIGIDFLRTKRGIHESSCFFRCYIRGGASVQPALRNLNAIREDMLASGVGLDDPKWTSFFGRPLTGEFSEDQLLVTSFSEENYERMNELGIASRDSEDLAKHFLKQIEDLVAPVV